MDVPHYACTFEMQSSQDRVMPPLDRASARAVREVDRLLAVPSSRRARARLSASSASVRAGTRLMTVFTASLA